MSPTNSEKSQPLPPETPTEPSSVDDKSTAGKGKEKEGIPIKKFRGVPEDVQLFEVFWKQVVELIKVLYILCWSLHLSQFVLKARPDLSIQDVTALLVSLTNLSLSCYPDRLEYVDQILGFTAEKIKDAGDR